VEGDVSIRAYLVLALWVPMAAVAFAVTKPERAALLVILGGVLFLPERAAFDLPLLPPMDKNGISVFCAFVGMLVFARRKVLAARPLRGVDMFFVLIALANIGTALTNGDPLMYGGGVDYDGVTPLQPIVLPGTRPYDIVSMTVRDVIAIYMPFLLGRALIRDREAAKALLAATVLGGLAYVPFMLLEMRLSPQLHSWVYGYYATFFGHAVRGEGFKPMVFMAGGLAVAIFCFMAVMSAAILQRVRQPIGPIPAFVALGLLWITLLGSRNMGANIFAFVCVPIVFVSTKRLAVRVATVLVVLVVVFPTMRATQTFPTDDLVTYAGKYNAERAGSLNFRFENEDILLEKAQERLWFGWGGFARNRVFDERGKDISVTDGEWIIRLGMRGIFGYVGSFGLLLMPVLMARRRISEVDDVMDQRLMGGLCLLVAANAVDLLPNGLFNHLPFFYAGALAGLASAANRRGASSLAPHAGVSSSP
jgi:hypothetical protein